MPICKASLRFRQKSCEVATPALLAEYASLVDRQGNRIQRRAFSPGAKSPVVRLVHPLEASPRPVAAKPLPCGSEFTRRILNAVGFSPPCLKVVPKLKRKRLHNNQAAVRAENVDGPTDREEPDSLFSERWLDLGTLEYEQI